MANALASSVRKMMTVDDAFSSLITGLEEGQDLTHEIMPLDRFLEEWAHLILRPRQRLLAKVLDNAANDLPLTDRLERYPFDAKTICLGFDGDKLMQTLPHCVELVDGVYWYDELKDWAMLLSRKNPYARVYENLQKDSDDPRKIILIIGRGGGKTTFAAGMAAQQSHRILSAENPHALFNLAPLKALRIQNVATSREQAGEFFDAFCTIVGNVKWFDGRYAPPKQGMVKFGKHLWAERNSSNSKSGRGRDTVVYIHDEIAFAEKTSGPRSDRALYTAIHSGLKTRAKGKGLELVLSSPAEADGMLFELFCQGEAGTLENSLVVQIASWEMIPGETRETYAAEYRRDEDAAETEFGAQFFTGAKNLLPNVRDRYPDMEAAYNLLVDPTGASLRLYPYDDEEKERAWRKRERRYDRVIHVDTSEGGDRLVIWMGHIRKGWVVTDLVKAWNREVGYTKELIPFIKRLQERVPIAQVSFDQFASHQAIQDLVDAGINAIKVPFSQVYNDEIARNTRQSVIENRVAMPTVPLELLAKADKLLEGDDWDDDPELWPTYSSMLLRREMETALKTLSGRAGGKRKGRLIAACAPTAGPVQTDDALDAFMSGAHQAILLSGGSAAFFTIARQQEGVTDKERKEALTIGGVEALPSKHRREVNCRTCKAYHVFETPEKFAPCPGCGQTLQLRI